MGGSAIRNYALSAAFVRNVKAGTKPRRYADGNGLYLFVKPGASGATKSWVQRIVIQGVRRELGLGSASLVTLKEARETAFQNRRLARAGGDPLALRHPQSPAFEDAVEAVIKMHEPTWRGSNGGRSAKQWRSSLRDHAYPRIGRTPVHAITSADVMALLLPIWIEKNETAQRIRRRISTVMKWAIAQGIRTDNPAGEDILAAMPKVDRQRSHQRAVPHSEVADAIARIRTADTNQAVRLVLEFLILCAVRSGEARLATWDEMDLRKATWTIPADRMKTKRQHRVPLSDLALEVLEQAAGLRVGELVFPSPIRGRAIATGTPVKVLAAAGIDAVPHGFRSSFRDWASEMTDAPHAVMEAALAHSVHNQAEAAYARSDLFERRRELMQQWADYVRPESPE